MAARRASCEHRTSLSYEQRQNHRLMTLHVLYRSVWLRQPIRMQTRANYGGNCVEYHILVNLVNLFL